MYGVRWSSVPLDTEHVAVMVHWLLVLMASWGYWGSGVCANQRNNPSNYFSENFCINVDTEIRLVAHHLNCFTASISSKSTRWENQKFSGNILVSLEKSENLYTNLRWSGKFTFSFPER